MSRRNIDVKSDYTVYIYDAYNRATGAILDGTSPLSYGSILPVDPNIDEILTSAAIETAVTLAVSNPGKFQVGQRVSILLDGRTDPEGQELTHEDIVTAVNVDAGTIGITTGITTPGPADDTGASAGNRVVRVYENRISLSFFDNSGGNPQVGNADWGWKGTLSYDSDLEVNDEIDLEVTFVGDPSGGLNTFYRICGKATESCDDS